MEEVAVDKTVLAEQFGMCERMVFEYFRMPGSPAYKVGHGRTSPWRCKPSEFAAWLKQKSEDQKG